MTDPNSGPHQGQPVLAAGRALSEASAALILVHGRGDSARGILGLSGVLKHPEFAYLAPQARGNTWYPQSFLSPIPANEPGISSGLQALAEVIAEVEAAGLPPEKIVLGGFSQGACLASEYAARNPRRYGGLLIFSGGLIGPPGTPRDYAGSLEGTRVFIGCSDVDFHIPLERVEETAEVLGRMGAEITKRIYTGMGHTINQDEIGHGLQVLESVAG